MARIESTERIKKFYIEIKKADWKDRSKSMEIIFDQVNLLVQSELDYYYKKRVYKRRLAGWVKFLTLLFGSLGLLVPLLKNTGIFDGYRVEPWAFVFVAVAGAFFTTDRVFTGTSGHTRYVITQIRLEKKLTLFNLRWLSKTAAMTPENQELVYAGLFAEILAFTETFYKILDDETQQWKGELSKVIEELSKNTSKSA